MKKIFRLIYIFFFCFSTSLLASNYYWVGGTGTWSDFATHWATTSGGTVFHVTIPSPNDDVFFDANSFLSAGDTVYMDTTITNCNNMDWSGAINAPVFSGSMNLKIYGSCILNPGMIWKVGGGITFKSATAGNIIDCAGLQLYNFSSHVDISFDGTGSWQLLDSLNIGSGISGGRVTLVNGDFKTNGHAITCNVFRFMNSNPCTLLLDNSIITCEHWNLDFSTHLTLILDADSAIINASQIDGGSGFTYYNVTSGDIRSDSCSFNDVSCFRTDGNVNTFHNVIMPASGNYVNGNGNIFNKLIMPGNLCAFGGNIQIDTLIFNNPGQTINFGSGNVISVNDLLLLQSDPGFPTSIQCNIGSATISIQTDTLCTDFIYLKNITATGGAVFFAGDHSVDLGGNTGWNWVRCAPLISNVWPGDCNYDLVTDNFDLLNIGVAFGDTGYVRPGASTSYTAQPCQDWYYQFINGTNLKHADCDGNGIVDANDTTAISLNYGLTHPARLLHQDENNSTGTKLDFVLPPVIVPGSAVSVPVTLGTSVDPAGAVYGIAFTVNYDPAFIQPGTMSVDYTASWVENTGNHLHLEKDFPGAGKTDVAFTRIDHSDASGYGIIATLNFTASPTANGPFNLSFSHVRVISHNEIEIPIQTGSGTTWINIVENENEIASSVFPNPMSDKAVVTFSNPNHEEYSFSMEDITGRIIFHEQTTLGNSFLVNRNNLGNGLYFYIIRSQNGKTSHGKIVME